MRFLQFLTCGLLLMSCGRNDSSNLFMNQSRSDSCYTQTKAALIALHPELISHESDFEFQINFDCRDSQLISSLNKPVTSATSPETVLQNVAPIALEMPFIDRALNILKPYCRSDVEVNGDYCMAADIDAAAVISNHPGMLSQLPHLIKETSHWIQIKENPDLIDVIREKYIGTEIEAVLLAGFIGLDDNGIQFDRLRANLLHMGRYADYAYIFPSTGQYATLGDLADIDDLFRIFFATRTGRATIHGTPIQTTKSYKIYAGVYFGCRLAMENEMPFFIQSEAFVIGALYEILKLKDIFQKPWDEAHIKTEIAKRAKASAVTGKQFSFGASHGFNLCKRHQAL